MLKSNSDLENLHYTPLYSLAEIMMGQSPDSKFVNDEQSGSPFLQGNGEFTTKYPKPIHWVTHPGKMAKKGDILISVRAPVGEINIADQDYCIGRGLAAIRFKNRIDPDYGWYAISFYKGQINRFAQGSTFLAVNSNDIRSIEIPMLEESEQLKIAEILTTVDDAIEQTEALIQKYQRIKQGLMQDLLKVKESWTILPLGIACKKGGGSVQTGPFGSQLHSSDYKDEGIPIITVEHLGDNEIIHKNLPLVGKEDYRRLSKYKIITGDLVFSRVGAIDRCAYVSENENGWLFSGRLLRVRPGSLFDSRFLSYLLNHYPSRLWILNNSVGSTMKCLNTTILSELPIPIPSMTEQKEIGEKISSIDRLIQDLVQEMEKLTRIKQGLMQDLLTGKVRVDALLKN